MTMILKKKLKFYLKNKNIKMIKLIQLTLKLKKVKIKIKLNGFCKKKLKNMNIIM